MGRHNRKQTINRNEPREYLQDPYSPFYKGVYALFKNHIYIYVLASKKKMG